MGVIEFELIAMTRSTPPTIELDDLTKSAAINLPGTLARYASGTARVSGFDFAVVDKGCDALLVRCAMRAGARP